MQAFDHYTPTSLPEALDLLRHLNGQLPAEDKSAIENPRPSDGQSKFQPVAGGSDLVIKLKKGLAAPKTIINIKRLPELKGLAYDDQSGLRLGALTTLGELTRSPLIRRHYPCLAETAALMASRQIRNFATIGGNLCNASPSADSAPPLIAFGATVHLVSSQGERDLPLEDFFLGPGQTALAPGELLQWIDVPPPDGQTVYHKHTPRAFMDISLVGVCVRLKIAERCCQLARIVLGAVAPTPLRARQAEAVLLDQTLTPELVEQAAKLAAGEAKPITDVGGSAWYRRRMVEVATRRNLNRILDFGF
ncbi:MAG: xanthine dehydrogenase family protein subunit M [Anaerolineae bacterium]|nr:xanthine dehydrogenase family protein subunit M [Anaerolineae bacterium]